MPYKRNRHEAAHSVVNRNKAGFGHETQAILDRMKSRFTTFYNFDTCCIAHFICNPPPLLHPFFVEHENHFQVGEGLQEPGQGMLKNGSAL